MHTPWVFSVSQLGGVYRVLEPLSPAMCSTWYLVILSLKSDRFRYSSMSLSVGMPMFMRKVVSVNLPMCDRCLPEVKDW